jgi:hypothetical protein
VIEQIKIYALFVKLADKRLLNFNFGVLKMAKGLVFAMENDEVSQLAGSDEGVAQAMAEATDAAQEVATEAQEIAQAADDTVAAAADAETLEKVQDVVAQTVQSGQGMDETTAQVAQVVVESICNRLGIPHAHRLMPATESFGSSNTRLAATKVALENGFTDTIKRIWEAIKKFVKNTWAKIKDFFARFFVNADKVKKAAQAMKEKASKLSGKRADKAKFTSKSVFVAFAQGGQLTDNTVVDVLSNHEKLTKSVINSAAAAATNITNLETAITAQAAAAADKVEAAAKSAEAYVGGIMKGATHSVTYVKDNKASNDKKDVEVSSVGGYIGGATLNFVKSTSKPSSGNGISTFTVEFTNRPVETQGEKEVKTLDITGIVAVCDGVIDLMDSTIEFGKKKSDIEKMASQLSKTVDVAISKTETTLAATDYEGKKVSMEIRELFNGLNATLTRVYTQTPAWNVKAGKEALSYCGQSMTQYKDA